MNLAISQSTVQALPQLVIDTPKWAIDNIGQCLFQGGHVEDWPRGIDYCLHCGRNWNPAKHGKYLVPLLAKPLCSTCGGSGRDAAHLHARQSRHPDHLYCDLHGDIGWDSKHGVCPDCSDGVPLGQVQLVVECPSCEGAGEGPNGWARCPYCDNGQRVVATGELVQLVEVVLDRDRPPHGAGPWLVIRSDTAPWETKPRQSLWIEEGPRGTDVTHLLPLAPWAESHWAGIITGLEMT